MLLRLSDQPTIKTTILPQQQLCEYGCGAMMFLLICVVWLGYGKLFIVLLTDGQFNGQLNRPLRGQLDGQLDGQLNTQFYGQSDRQLNRKLEGQ